jgi:L-2-hydroxyglutarate oxidase
MSIGNVDFCIIGSGAVGLSLATQLTKQYSDCKIVILEKESAVGLHSSGRNSGVLHAGIYYKPDSIKAKVCVPGAQRLREWILERNLPLNQCGKIIVPQKEHLDGQLDILAERAKANGSVVQLIDAKQLKQIIPCAATSSGRALWSPQTAVTKPRLVIQRMAQELLEQGVQILVDQEGWSVSPKSSHLTLKDGTTICYGHLFNCGGLQALNIAKQFDVEHNLRALPFKGLYWELKRPNQLHVPCNLYPVPDLDVPFLGVHFTPSADEEAVISIGPTATPALGQENYGGFSAVEPINTLINFFLLSKLYLTGQGGFRKYTHEQLLLAIKPLMLKEAQRLIPSLTSNNIQVSQKVGIRSQLLDMKTNRLCDDFICIHSENSSHILNAISPAFTASFELADLILKTTKQFTS